MRVKKGNILWYYYENSFNLVNPEQNLGNAQRPLSHPELFILSTQALSCQVDLSHREAQKSKQTSLTHSPMQLERSLREGLRAQLPNRVCNVWLLTTGLALCLGLVA